MKGALTSVRMVSSGECNDVGAVAVKSEAYADPIQTTQAAHIVGDCDEHRHAGRGQQPPRVFFIELGMRTTGLRAYPRILE